MGLGLTLTPTMARFFFKGLNFKICNFKFFFKENLRIFFKIFLITFGAQCAYYVKYGKFTNWRNKVLVNKYGISPNNTVCIVLDVTPVSAKLGVRQSVQSGLRQVTPVSVRPGVDWFQGILDQLLSDIYP